MLDLATWSWEPVVAKGGPSARSGHRMAVVRDRLLVFGGFFDNLRSLLSFALQTGYVAVAAAFVVLLPRLPGRTWPSLIGCPYTSSAWPEYTGRAATFWFRRQQAKPDV